MAIESHSRLRQIELGRSLAARRKIYLDARYWIILRDAALGVSAEPNSLRLLLGLRRGVREGRLICPISASMFLELMKQSYSPNRRIGTAQCVDELSLGVSLIPPKVVVGTEIHSFLLKAKGGANLHPMQELVWTKVGFTLGDTYPSMSQLSPEDELTIQKAFFEHMWDHSLVGIVQAIGDIDFPKDGFSELSRRTNQKNAEHKHELRSFKQTYDIELRGAIEIAGNIAADVLQYLAEKEAGRALALTEEERAAAVNGCRNLLYHAFQKKQETKSALRSLHIAASIHAAMRWDKSRKFKANDYYDFEHAIAALGYCDAFFTEGPLSDLVTRPQMTLETINRCHVLSDVEAAADHVAELLQPAAGR